VTSRRKTRYDERRRGMFVESINGSRSGRIIE
jgi:hypothetical protein